MSDLIGNPEDRFSHDAAPVLSALSTHSINSALQKCSNPSSAAFYAVSTQLSSEVGLLVFPNDIT